MKLSYTRNGQEFSTSALLVGEITADVIDGAVKALAFYWGIEPKSVFYLAQYGWNQSLQDSVAGLAKKVREKAEKDDPGLDDDEIVAMVHAAEVEQMGDRADAIRNGTLGAKAGITKNPVEAMFIRVAREMFAAFAKSKGKSTGKVGTPDYLAMLEKYIEIKRDDITTETQSRLEKLAAVGTDEAEDLVDQIFG